jgi:hypothetical protein
MTMNHDGDDGKHSNGHVSEYFQIFKNQNLCGREGAVDWATQPLSGVTRLD